LKYEVFAVRELEIDWAALHSAFQMNMPEVRCFLSMEDGRVLKTPPGDPLLAQLRNEPEKYVPVEAVPSRIQYQWLDSFIKTVEDEPVRVRMEAAVNGKGAFRRFKDILLTLPDERRRWFEFRDLLLRQRIVEWVREVGIEPANEPPWVNGTAPAVAPSTAVNSDKDVDELRDFLIAWADGRPPADAVAPLSLEKLASEIAQHFKVRRVQGP
jgi:hypothetical protein